MYFGYEGYYKVSASGKVFRICTYKNKPCFKELASISSKKYLLVHLCKNGIRNKRTLHRIVAEAFFGKCPANMECAHIDGNKFNNHVSNLEWKTHLDNEKDKIVHGTLLSGKNHPNARIGIKLANLIRKDYANNKITYKQLAAKYNLCLNSVAMIIRNESWSNLDDQ